MGAAKDIAEFPEEGLGDGEAQEVRGREPILVGGIVEFSAYDMHGGRRGGFVEVGGEVTDPQAGHDQEETQTGDDDRGLLALSGVQLCALGGLARGTGGLGGRACDHRLFLVEPLQAVVHGRALRQGMSRGGTHESWGHGVGGEKFKV